MYVYGKPAPAGSVTMDEGDNIVVAYSTEDSSPKQPPAKARRSRIAVGLSASEASESRPGRPAGACYRRPGSRSCVSAPRRRVGLGSKCEVTASEAEQACSGERCCDAAQGEQGCRWDVLSGGRREVRER